MQNHADLANDIELRLRLPVFDVLMTCPCVSLRHFFSGLIRDVHCVCAMVWIEYALEGIVEVILERIHITHTIKADR